jgi:hypothetical protein
MERRPSHAHGRPANSPWWPLTGRRFHRRPQECPDWCARGHACTAQYGYPKGEHRSPPITVRTSYGVIVCTRVQSVSGRGRLELRLQVDLSADEHLASVQAVRVAEEIDTAVRTALATAEGWLDVTELDMRGLPGPDR